MRIRSITGGLFTFFVAAVAFSSCAAGDKGLKEGDIIFQSSSGGQGKAIQIATQSEYSHCGIIYFNDGKAFVYEAVQPVKLTPLNEWIKRGDKEHYVVKRLKDADKVLTAEVLKKMRSAGETFNGKDYDIYFGWRDNEIYCSELVWKIYQRGAGIEIGKLQKLSSFHLDNPLVKQKLAERYGDNIPMDETVISPAAIFASDMLETVVEH